MPQLDFHNPMTLSQVVWMFIIFGGLYLLMARWALPRVAQVVDARAARITADLESARQAKAQAEAVIRELKEATRHAHSEAQGEISAAIAQAKADAAAQARSLNERLDQQIAAAEAKIGEARAAAMGALRQVAADAAELVVSRMTSQQPDRAVVASAVDRAVAVSAPSR